jgi:hypothetical protein
VLLIFNAEATTQAAEARRRLPVPPHGTTGGPGHAVLFGDSRRTSSDGSGSSKAKASPSKPISNGRRAAVRSISAIRLGNSLECAEAEIWGL